MAYMIMPVYNVDKAVGPGKPNIPDDVKLVQHMLTEFAKVFPGWAPPTPLAVDGAYSDSLRLWILSFQMHACNVPTPTVTADGIMHPMRTQGKHDWDSDMGIRRSTLFMLNLGLHKRARTVHDSTGARLGLKSSADR